MNRSDWLWLGGLGLLAVGFWASRDVDGSGTPGSEQRTVASFHEIEIDGAMRVEVEVGPEPSIRIEGDDNLLAFVETEVSGGKLSIEGTRSLDPELPLVVKVTTPDLTKLESNGAVTVALSGVDNDELEVEINGSGEVSAAGHTKRLDIDISGSGEADARALTVETVSVDVSGSGEVDVAAPQELAVEISGSGTVRYDGTPRIDQDISGSGKIVRR